MEIEPEEQEIVELLTKLKNRDGSYPKNLLASRRQQYLSQIASIGAGIGVGAGVERITKASKGGTAAHLPSAGSLIESILIVAIVIQTGIVAYNYRDKIAEFFNSVSSVPTAVSIPVTGSSLPEVVPSDTPVVTETPTDIPSLTPTTEESTETTDPSVAGSGNGGNNTTQGVAATETPRPNNDDNGNHFGQTPKPPRPTQEKSIPKSTKSNDNGSNKKP